jgi:hypothetical protein
MRLLLSGNELYDYFAEGWFIQSGSFTTSTNQPGGRRSPQGNGGKYYFYLAASTATNTIAHRIFNPAVGLCTSVTQGGLQEIYGRVAFNTNIANTTQTLLSFFNSSNGVSVGAIGTTSLGSGGTNGFAAFNGAGTQQAGSAINLITSGVWLRLEWHFKCSASGGLWEGWVNDVPAFSVSGLNTSNGTTVCFDSIIIGPGGNFGSTWQYDDIAINDTTGPSNVGRPGEGYVIALFPTRSGTFSQLQNAFGTSAENYDHVNRPITAYTDPTNVSLYVGTNTPYQKDSYKMTSLPQELGGISALKVISNVARNGSGITNAKLLMEPGSPQPIVAPTGVAASGGFGTAGDHQFCVVNKIGGSYGLPSPMSLVVNLTGGNGTVNLTIPTAPTLQQDPQSVVTAREIYASKANTDTTVDAASNAQQLPGMGGPSQIFLAGNMSYFSVLPNTTMTFQMSGTALPFNNIGSPPGVPPIQVPVVNVASTVGWPTQGTFFVQTSAGLYSVPYTGVTATSFLGCTFPVSTGATAPNLLVNSIATGSNGVNVSTFTGTQTLNVNSNPVALTFPSSGLLIVPTSGGTAVLSYGNIQASPPAFLNVTTVSGTGTLTGSATVSASNFIQYTGTATLGSVNSQQGIAYISNAAGFVHQILYTGTTTSPNSLTGCTGGFGSLATGGFVSGPLFLVGTVNDNTTTAFAFSIADSNFGSLILTTEIASSPIAIVNGAFNYYENIFDHNPTTGLPWGRDEIEQIEAGIQFLP